jgi:hypothetical protein
MIVAKVSLATVVANKAEDFSCNDDFIVEATPL